MEANIYFGRFLGHMNLDALLSESMVSTAVQEVEPCLAMSVSGERNKWARIE